MLHIYIYIYAIIHQSFSPCVVPKHHVDRDSNTLLNEAFTHASECLSFLPKKGLLSVHSSNCLKRKFSLFEQSSLSAQISVNV